MTTLSNLKQTNKFFSKNITKKDLLYCMDNTIKNTPRPINHKYELYYWSIIEGNKNGSMIIDNKNFICHDQKPIIIPTNTIWKFQIHLSIPSYYDGYFQGEIKNVFNKVTIIQSGPTSNNQLFHNTFGNAKLSAHKNIITLDYLHKVRSKVNATMTIQEIKF